MALFLADLWFLWNTRFFLLIALTCLDDAARFYWLHLKLYCWFKGFRFHPDLHGLFSLFNRGIWRVRSKIWCDGMFSGGKRLLLILERLFKFIEMDNRFSVSQNLKQVLNFLAEHFWLVWILLAVDTTNLCAVNIAILFVQLHDEMPLFVRDLLLLHARKVYLTLRVMIML